MRVLFTTRYLVITKRYLVFMLQYSMFPIMHTYMTKTCQDNNTSITPSIILDLSTSFHGNVRIEVLKQSSQVKQWHAIWGRGDGCEACWTAYSYDLSSGVLCTEQCCTLCPLIRVLGPHMPSTRGPVHGIRTGHCSYHGTRLRVNRHDSHTQDNTTYSVESE